MSNDSNGSHVTANLEAAESSCDVSNEQFLDEVFGGGVHLTWPLHFTLEDLLVNTKWMLIKEWRVPVECVCVTV